MTYFKIITRKSDYPFKLKVLGINSDFFYTVKLKIFGISIKDLVQLTKKMFKVRKRTLSHQGFQKEIINLKMAADNIGLNVQGGCLHAALIYFLH